MIFASDLDNTIIFSYKEAIKKDVCVEIKDGKKLSFISAEAITLLDDIRKRCLFVPITTRSLEQYERINLGFIPQYAIAAHGAILLVNGRIDETWSRETQRYFKIQLPEIKENKFVFDVRYVDEFFVCAKSNDSEKAVNYLRNKLDSTVFEVCSVHNKVYIFPIGLNKGFALQRLKKQISLCKVICAGDSVLDIPMLKIADIAIVPETLNFQKSGVRRIEEVFFARKTLHIVSQILS